VTLFVRIGGGYNLLGIASNGELLDSSATILVSDYATLIYTVRSGRYSIFGMFFFFQILLECNYMRENQSNRNNLISHESQQAKTFSLRNFFTIF